MTKGLINIGFLIILLGMLGCMKSEPILPEEETTTPWKPIRLHQGAIKHAPSHINADQMRNDVEHDTCNASLNTQLAQTIFRDVLTQGESLWGRYFTDGQFAYASAIRRYVEKSSGLQCEKIFVFGDVTCVSPRYGCSASWKYDVACVLRGDHDTFVIDPRLSFRVLTVDEWLKGHTQPTTSTSNQGSLMWEIRSGVSFTPKTNIPADGYLEDSNYVYTNAMLAYYADSVGCGCLSSSSMPNL